MHSWRPTGLGEGGQEAREPTVISNVRFVHTQEPGGGSTTAWHLGKARHAEQEA